MAEPAIRIEPATVADAATVAVLVGRLLAELGGFHAFDLEAATALCERLLATGRYVALLARDERDEAVGVLTLQECPALYVAGRVGWIQEVYVAPAARSHGVGHLLVDLAVAYGLQHGWQRLEVKHPRGGSLAANGRLLRARRVFWRLGAYAQAARVGIMWYIDALPAHATTPPY